MSADSPRYVVSACLAGVFSRYDGSREPMEAVVELVRRGVALPVCPEQLGGLPTPRPPCERRGERVVNKHGVDQTEEFTRGADEALRLARLFGATRAVLKSGSPTCGCGEIHDGSFSGRRVAGDGVFATACKAAGIDVLTEADLEDDA